MGHRLVPQLVHYDDHRSLYLFRLVAAFACLYDHYVREFRNLLYCTVWAIHIPPNKGRW
jgi:hypothetical protein